MSSSLEPNVAAPAARVSPNLIDTGTPPIPEAYIWADRYDGRGGPLINLAQAAPGSPPPPELLSRFATGAGDPASARYGSIFGDAPLRAAFAAEQTAIYGGDIGPGDVAITAGCNMAFFITALALAKAGDNIILPTPWYFNHEMALSMLGIEARQLPTAPEAGFIPDVAAAARLIDAKTKAIVLVTPNNPTGAVYPPATIAAFQQLARDKGIWLILDETYRDFMPESAGRPHDVFADAAWRDGVIQLYSFSKAYCMPGHRLGAITAPPVVMQQLNKALDTVQICPPRPAQTALTWGIAALSDWRAANRRDINARAQAFKSAFAQLNGWQILSLGAYFAYVRHPFDGVPAAQVAEGLCFERGVLGLPGSYFGAGQTGHLRLAFANADVATIEHLPDRFRGFRP
jgi:aspartate/methionine/tyrosine aminotransferase